MLGRLEMDVDQCIDAAYNEMCEEIFKDAGRKVTLTKRHKSKPWRHDKDSILVKAAFYHSIL